MPHEEWTSSLTSSLPRFFNILSGRCTLVLSECLVECSKAVLSSQSPVLESYFMSSERDINKIITRRRQRYLGEVEEEEEEDLVMSDDEEDETSVIIMTDYYGYDDIVSEFFRSFYTGEITINSDTFRVTMKLACQYEVAWVISECCSFLETCLCEDNFIDHYKFLMNFKNDSITRVTLHKLTSFDYHKLLDHFQPLSPEWLSLDETHFITLLDNLAPPSEIYTAHLLFLWLEHDEIHRKHKLESLISHLRLVHVPQSFVGDVIIKFAEVKGQETKGLYRMVLGSQSFFFSQSAGLPPRRLGVDMFPHIYETRNSFVKHEEMRFVIPVEGIKSGEFENDEVSLRVSDQGNFQLSFRRRCCFVFITSAAIVEKYPVSKILIPVSENSSLDGGVNGPFASKGIEIFEEIATTSDELGLASIEMVAVMLDSNR